jgi:hypothetical protein
MSDPAADDHGARIDRLMDAIDLIKADRREEARQLLRELIRENADFEDAWLWMSLAVDTLDQSAVCLDNVLRVNPGNAAAAAALYRLRSQEIESTRTRARLRFWRDTALMGFWLLVMGLLSTFLCSFYNGVWWAVSERIGVTLTP